MGIGNRARRGHSALPGVTGKELTVAGKDSVEVNVRMVDSAVSICERSVTREQVWRDDDMLVSCAPTIYLSPFKMCSTQTTITKQMVATRQSESDVLGATEDNGAGCSNVH